MADCLEEPSQFHYMPAYCEVSFSIFGPCDIYLLLFVIYISYTLLLAMLFFKGM
jgi:hypothetical protein